MASREAHAKDYRGRFKELQALELEVRKDDLIEVKYPSTHHVVLLTLVGAS